MEYRRVVVSLAGMRFDMTPVDALAREGWVIQHVLQQGGQEVVYMARDNTEPRKRGRPPGPQEIKE